MNRGVCLGGSCVTKSPSTTYVPHPDGSTIQNVLTCRERAVVIAAGAFVLEKRGEEIWPGFGGRGEGLSQRKHPPPLPSH